MLYLIFKIVWSGFTKPFRMFNRKIRNKTNSSIWSVFKFAFKTVVIFFCFMTVVLMTVTTVSNSKPNAGDKVTVNRVDTQVEEEIYENNGDGTINGLNLLLINNIQTEGFVKEYLTLAKENYEGKLNDYSIHVEVGTAIGLAMGEQGGYSQSGYILPNTSLPWDSSTNSPKWDKSINATLSQATMEIFNKIGMNPNAGKVGSYVSPYQQTASYFTNGTYRPSSMLGYGMSSGRTTGDWSYFPDQLAGLDAEITNTGDLDTEQLSPTALAMNASENHNVGPGWKKQFLGVYKSGDYTAGLITLESEFSTGFEKFQTQLAQKVVDPSLYKWFANFLLMENGWNVTTRSGDTGSGGNTSYSAMSKVNKSAAFSAFQQLGLGTTMEEMQTYLSNHLKNPPNDNYGLCLTASTQGTLWKDFGSDGNMFMLTETAGHILASSFMGPIYYARMLKYAGVDVDPTNPSDYMNTISDGEWKPNAETDWLKELGVDLNKLTANRVAYLNEAKKWLGSWYLWGGMEAPEKDSSGNWISGNGKGFDCSRYTQYVALQALGVDISRTTYTQIVNSNLDTIDRTEAKPGDIIYYYNGSPSATHHVAIFLKDNGDGTDLIMHAPQTGDVIKIANRSNNPNKTVYRRIKVIDN